MGQVFHLDTINSGKWSLTQQRIFNLGMDLFKHMDTATKRTVKFRYFSTLRDRDIPYDSVHLVVKETINSSLQ